MQYKQKEVPDPICPCCNPPEIKETELHQLHCPLLPIMRLFKEIGESFKKWTKEKYTETTMGAMLCWYIKGKGRKICQDSPHLPMELSSISKSQEKIGWDNITQGRIDTHWNQWKSDYLKKITSRKTGLNLTSYFM